jgi:hypothetical protein
VCATSPSQDGTSARQCIHRHVISRRHWSYRRIPAQSRVPDSGFYTAGAIGGGVAGSIAMNSAIHARRRALLTESESREWFGTSVGVRGPPRIESSARSTGAGWVLSGNLRRGDILATTSGQRLVVVDAAARATETVYNFEVRGTHSYFVGETNAWVHNVSQRKSLPLGEGVADRLKSLDGKTGVYLLQSGVESTWDTPLAWGHAPGNHLTRARVTC